MKRNLLSLLAAALLSSIAGAANACVDEKADNKDVQAAKVAESVGVAEATLAARMALEGESAKSPLLLLAAADLLEGVKSSERSAAGLTAEPSTGKAAAASDGDKKALSLDPQALRKRALELAASDKERALLQQWLDRPASRGLVYSQGKDLKDVEIKGVTYKVVADGVLQPGQRQTLRNVIFEGKKPAIVAVIGDGDGDLDLWVYDGNTKGRIGEDTDSTSVCRVAWTTLFEGPFQIEVANVGQIAERYIVIVNW
ncbi:MAG: hypothetical protein ACKO3T_08770 [Planctomycetaceae bacterium]